MTIRADISNAIATLPTLASRAWAGLVRWISPPERDSILATSGIAHRIIWSLPEDALAEGWTSKGEEDNELDELDDSLRLEDRILVAAGAARADGGAWLWVVVRGDDDFSQPLDDGPHDIAAVHVVEREELVATKWNVDLESPNYARPELAQVTMVRDGITAPTELVHGSRLVYVPGLRALPSQCTGDRQQGYDLSALQVYEPAIRDIEKAWASGATLIERLSMPQLRISDFSKATKNKEGWVGRLKVFLQSMTTKGLMVMMGTDELQWVGPSVSGFTDLIRSLAERLSSVEGYPLTRLLGQAPAGLTADDAAGARTYGDLVARYRRTVLQPAILDVYRIAFGDEERQIVWPAVDRPSRTELATLSLQNAQRDAVLVQSGVIDVAEARERFRREGEMDTPILDEMYDLAPMDERETPPLAAEGLVIEEEVADDEPPEDVEPSNDEE